MRRVGDERDRTAPETVALALLEALDAALCSPDTHPLTPRGTPS